MEGGGLVLGNLVDLPEHLRGGRLVEADLGVDEADGVQDPGDPEGGGLTCEDRLHPRGLDEGLRGEVVDLGRPVLPQYPDQRDLVEQIARHEDQAVLDVRDAFEVDRGRAPHHAHHLIALLEQEFSQVGTVLARDAGDQCSLAHIAF